MKMDASSLWRGQFQSCSFLLPFQVQGLMAIWPDKKTNNIVLEETFLFHAINFYFNFMQTIGFYQKHYMRLSIDLLLPKSI